MDPLSALIDAGERTDDLRLGGEWTLALRSNPAITVVAVAAGAVWCHTGVSDPVRLGAGELLVLQPHRARILSSSEEPPPFSPGGEDVVVSGATTTGDTHVLLRFFPVDAALVTEFFASFPPERVLGAVRDSALWEALREEAAHLSVARSSALGRLLDLLFIDAMRRWASDDYAQGWMRAVLDPLVGGALHMFHERPEHPWTLQEVADLLGTSRASFSRRFELFVGEPPMIYLHHWRLSRAAALLVDEGLPIAVVARRTGFTDPFRFSAAFTKEFGVSPARYRRIGPCSAGSA